MRIVLLLASELAARDHSLENVARKVVEVWANVEAGSRVNHLLIKLKHDCVEICLTDIVQTLNAWVNSLGLHNLFLGLAKRSDQLPVEVKRVAPVGSSVVCSAMCSEVEHFVPFVRPRRHISKPQLVEQLVIPVGHRAEDNTSASFNDRLN